jgi:hypothetical protein
MNKLFKEARVAGIIEPGHCYYLSPDSSREGDMPMDQVYLIRRDEDIIPAIDMETCIVMECYQELLEFLGWERVSDISFVFRMRCYFKEEKEVGEYVLYIHRLKEFAEELEEMKELFGVRDYSFGG